MSAPFAAPAADDTIEALRDSARTLVSRQSDFARIRTLRDRTPGYDRTTWKQMAELGWLGIMVPSSLDGMALGLPAAAGVAEEYFPSRFRQWPCCRHR